MKKYVPFIIYGVLAVMLITALCCSVAALVISKKTASQVETLTSDYHSFALKVDTKLESINDNLTFLRDYCTSAPNITLGDTYIDRTRSKVKQ